MINLLKIFTDLREILTSLKYWEGEEAELMKKKRLISFGAKAFIISQIYSLGTAGRKRNMKIIKSVKTQQI